MDGGDKNPMEKATRREQEGKQCRAPVSYLQDKLVPQNTTRGAPREGWQGEGVSQPSSIRAALPDQSKGPAGPPDSCPGERPHVFPLGKAHFAF